MQQGVENFFATQRILVDLITRQNADVMHMLRERLNDPAYCPAEILTDLTGEGVTNFVEGQKLLLSLAQQEYELVTNGVKDRVGGSPAAAAATDFLRRSFDTFVEMQQDILKIANKQTHTWLTAVKAGKPYDSEGLVEAARESFDTFVHAQKTVPRRHQGRNDTGNGRQERRDQEGDRDHRTGAPCHGHFY